MRVMRMNSSATIAQYRIDFDNQEEASLTKDQLCDCAESYNYGGSVIQRDHEHALINVYID